MSEALPATFDVHPPSDEPVPFIDLKAQYATISSEIQEAVQRVFSEQQFVLGDEVAEFECDIAEYCDSQDAVGCASGSDALELSLMALDIGPGDEVITSPFSFFASTSAICRVGATPVFADIDPVSFNFEPTGVEAAITDKTRAIMPIHLFGQCAEMEPLWRMAVRGGLSIIEDAAQSIGAEYRGRRAGVLGTVGCFSFFPTKNLGGAGDGGLITTDDPSIATRLRQLRVHGDVGGYRHSEIGINSRLDALQAAVLRVKLAHLEDWPKSRQENAKRYGELFRHYQLLDSIELPTVLPERRHVFNQYCIRVKAGCRDELMKSMREANVGCTVYYPLALHLQECFQHLGHLEGDFPEAEAATADILALPIYSELRADQQETVVRTIARALGRLSTDRDSSPQPERKFSSPLREAA